VNSFPVRPPSAGTVRKPRCPGLPAPRLVIVSNAVRTDLLEPLAGICRFQVWHLYRTMSRDVTPGLLDSRTMSFRNPLDLFLKIVRIRPSLIQGSEPYDFPHGFCLSIVAFLSAGILRVPYFFPTMENLPPEVKFRKRSGLPVGLVLAPLLRAFMRIYATKALLIFAVNKGAAANLSAAKASPRRVRRELYGTWGVDLGQFTPDPGGQCRGRGTTRNVLFVGRIVREKGIPELLEAFLRVRERLPDLRLTLIGEGPMVSEVRSFAIEHSLQHVLSLPGVVQNRELPSHIRMADIVVSPSIAVDAWAEQVGMVNIQSIACGTPVVTTASGSIPEFIEDGVSGVVVPEKDPSALASAMIRLLTDAQLHCRLSTACRRAAELRYDAFRNVAATEQVLLAALNKRPRGRGPISAPADFSG